MNHHKFILILAGIAILPVLLEAEPQYDESGLRIHMPREITVKDSLLTLGQVSIIRGNAALAAAAGQVELGRLSTPDQSIRINRNLLLGRLACSGIAASRVTLTGAEETVISREHELITDSRLVEAAAAFLKQNLPDPSICHIDPLRTPGQLVLAGEGDKLRFVCQLVNHGTRNQSKVQVIVFDGPREVGRKDVYFRFRYNVRKLVAKSAIAQGDVLTADNVRIETAVSNYPEPAGWKVPYGLCAVRPIPANTVVIDSMLRSSEPEVVIKRNQSVSIKIENAGLIASAAGKALQDGAAGEYIKVQNVDSKIIIMAKVNHDGTVEPVY